ncbi:MAG TPA: hypothetical protein VM163_08195 [bacterium]|nr:hypothetical protein [bacterium]
MAEYTKAVVTFIDILGFKELVRTRTCDDIKRILGFFSQVSHEAKLDAGIPGMWESTFVYFSDSIVRTVRNIDDRSKHSLTEDFYFELHALKHIQCNLLLEGLVIRGAITVGDIFAEGKIVFGPALIRACKLESEVAEYPRVIIDQGAFDELDRSEWFHGAIENYARMWDDGVLFVDYLRGHLNETAQSGPSLGIPFRAGIEPIVRHRKLVESNLRKFAQNPAILEKYRWLADYHNSLVTMISESGESFFEICETSQDELLVQDEDIVKLHEP